MTHTSITGGCQCGAVRYRVGGALGNPHVCHCRMCQKAAGNYFLPLAGAPRGAVAITRGEPAWFFSSATVRRGFCAACGTPLFFDPVDSDQLLVTLGSLDEPARVVPVSEDSVESRLPFLAAWANTRQKVSEDDFCDAELQAIRASSRQHPDHDTDIWPLEDDHD